MPKIKRMLNPDMYAFNEQKMELTYKKTGNVIFFKSADSPLVAFEGADVDLLAFDEEPPKKVFYACLIRITGRKHARVIIASTPIGGMTWMYDEIKKPAELQERDDVELIVNTQLDNPLLDPKQVMKDYERDRKADPIMAEIRYFGKDMHLAGSIFDLNILDAMIKMAPKPKVGVFV